MSGEMLHDLMDRMFGDTPRPAPFIIGADRGVGAAAAASILFAPGLAVCDRNIMTKEKAPRGAFFIRE